MVEDAWGHLDKFSKKLALQALYKVNTVARGLLRISDRSWKARRATLVAKIWKMSDL